MISQGEVQDITPLSDNTVRIRLHGHRHAYVVRVRITDAGPRLTELTITPGDDTQPTVEYDTLRSIPVRRLAYAAARWFTRAGGQWAEPGDTDADDARPDQRTARGRLTDEHYRQVADEVRAAARAYLPVRQTVAARFHASVPAIDKWIRTAKDRGYLDENYMPHATRPTGGTEQ